jgi:Capsule assembly protein Wzi
VGFTFHDIELSFGKQSAWLGPGEGGPLLLSNNAEPFAMVKIESVSPFHFPGLSSLLGPARFEFLLGRLSGQRWVAVTPDNVVPPDSVVLSEPGMNLIRLKSATQPFIHGEKISFKPTPNLEFGMGITYVFGGPGFPFTWRRFLHTYSLSSGLVNGPNSPGDRRSQFDFTYRLPKLRDWTVFYLDSLTEDEISPIGSTRPSLNLGLYFPRLPKIQKLDVRLEGVYTDAPNLTIGINGFVYWNARYPSGYTNNGNLLASWVGRQGQGEQAWARYWISPRNRLELGYRHSHVDRVLLGGGGLSDVSAGAEFSFRHGLSISGSVQYEQWNFPALSPTAQSNVTASLQFTLDPRALAKH